MNVAFRHRGPKVVVYVAFPDHRLPSSSVCGLPADPVGLPRGPGVRFLGPIGIYSLMRTFLGSGRGPPEQEADPARPMDASGLP